MVAAAQREILCAEATDAAAAQAYATSSEVPPPLDVDAWEAVAVVTTFAEPPVEREGGDGEAKPGDDQADDSIGVHASRISRATPGVRADHLPVGAQRGRLECEHDAANRERRADKEADRRLAHG
jgi:hypothetical protein